MTVGVILLDTNVISAGDSQHAPFQRYHSQPDQLLPPHEVANPPCRVVGTAATFNEAAVQEVAQLTAVSADAHLCGAEFEVSFLPRPLERDARWLSPWLR
jgi:hypothetical protein